MIRAGIVGISGYSGRETLALLLKHPNVRVTYVSANNTKGPVTDIWPQFQKQTALHCDTFQMTAAAELCDLLFLAVPHTVAMSIVPGLIKANKRVIDLSADYRLKDPGQYAQWYGKDHTDPANLPAAVYGLPELFREKIRTASLIANPGCYPTAAILALAPLVSTHADLIQSIFIDAKSGISGAGKKAAAPFMFCELNENFTAYKVLKHQHAPEIGQVLNLLSERSLPCHFVPHLLPVNRGIFETVYVTLKKKVVLSDLHAVYQRFYKTEPFVRVLSSGQQPELKNVCHTNFADIGLASDPDGTLLVITSAIDNLLKGAAGQAVQNMNIMCYFEETLGLK